MGTPPSVTRPAVGSMSRFISRSSVDFPAPLAPVTAVHRPAGMLALTSARSVAEPRVTVTCSSRRPSMRISCALVLRNHGNSDQPATASDG